MLVFLHSDQLQRRKKVIQKFQSAKEVCVFLSLQKKIKKTNSKECQSIRLSVVLIPMFLLQYQCKMFLNIEKVLVKISEEQPYMQYPIIFLVIFEIKVSNFY